jgi:hypothetical protein
MVGMLEVAETAAAKGNQSAVNRMLAAFIHQVSARSRWSLTSAQAAQLIQAAKSLMS